jgi:hypothetical protein
MKRLLLFLCIIASLIGHSQTTEIKEAQLLAKSINEQRATLDQTKPIPPALVDQINQFHKKVEMIIAHDDGVCLVMCGVLYSICVNACGGSMQCVIWCSYDKDFCVINCHAQSLNK